MSQGSAPVDAQPAARSLARAADRRIGERLRTGDPEALAAVRDRCGATVFAYLRHVLRDRDAAEDVFQQVFTEVWRRGAAYDAGRGSISAWVLTIARSRAIDELRRRRPEPMDPDVLPEPSVPAPQEEALERWRIANLLTRLPAEERDPLRLRFYAELSQTEIAERLDIPLGTVKSRMVRGLERLRGLMDDEGLA